MNENKEMYQFFIEEGITFENYIKMMSKDGELAGQLEFKAIGELFELNINVHQKEEPHLIEQEFTAPGRNKGTLHVSYHLRIHYNSVRLSEDPVKKGCKAVGMENINLAKHGITENIEAPEVSAFAPQKESSSNYEELVE